MCHIEKSGVTKLIEDDYDDDAAADGASERTFCRFVCVGWGCAPVAGLRGSLVLFRYLANTYHHT